MSDTLWDTYQRLKAQGITPQKEACILKDIEGLWTTAVEKPYVPTQTPSIYSYFDLMMLQAMPQAKGNYTSHIRTIDELLAKDKQREKDGFPRKINVGRLIKPEEIADAICFMVSNAAVSGELWADAGWHPLP